MQLLSQIRDKNPHRFPPFPTLEVPVVSDSSETELDFGEQEPPVEPAEPPLATSTPARKKGRKKAATSQATAILERMDARMHAAEKAEKAHLAKVRIFLEKENMFNKHITFYNMFNKHIIFSKNIPWK